MAVLIVGLIPSAYEPRWVSGELVAERQPHESRCCVRDIETGRIEWVVQYGTLYTSDAAKDAEGELA